MKNIQKSHPSELCSRITDFFCSRTSEVHTLVAASLLCLALPTVAAAQSATLTTLHTFQGTEGANPLSTLVEGQDGNLYGTTEYGGLSFSPSATFQTGYGTVFKITKTGTFTNVHLFNLYDGFAPSAGVVQNSDGTLFGTTFGGGQPTGNQPSYGSVFSLDATGSLTTLHSFRNGIDGNAPDAPLVQGPDGNFYGTTIAGGKVVRTYYAVRNSYGAIFKVTPLGDFTSLYAFNLIDGASPAAGLVLGNDGNFYGTTRSGGSSNKGTIFKITPTGQLTTLYNFNGSDGSFLESSLTLGSDGNFYGTTSYGGTENNGTVFKITPTGQLTTLHSFANNNGVEGCTPRAGLVQAQDGNFYGTTAYCGSGTYKGGTVYKITPEGVLTTLYSFTGGSNGCNPYAGLVQASDGNFYGTTWLCGLANSSTGLGFGTVFKLSLP